MPRATRRATNPTQAAEDLVKATQPDTQGDLPDARDPEPAAVEPADVEHVTLTADVTGAVTAIAATLGLTPEDLGISQPEGVGNIHENPPAPIVYTRDRLRDVHGIPDGWHEVHDHTHINRDAPLRVILERHGTVNVRDYEPGLDVYPTEAELFWQGPQGALYLQPTPQQGGGAE